MFKKRNKAQKIDIEKQLEGIPDDLRHTQTNNIINQGEHQDARNHNIANINLEQLENGQMFPDVIIQLNDSQPIEQKDKNLSNETVNNINNDEYLKEESKMELEKCFQEFRKFNQQIQKQQTLQEEVDDKVLPHLYQHDDDIDNNHDLSGQQNASISYRQAKPKLMMQQAIMQDQDDVQILEYRQDFGEISPELSSGENEDGFQNQLIRRSVNRQTYLKLSQGLKNAHHLSEHQKILQKINKISVTSVQRKIIKDIRQKSLRRIELKNQLKQMNDKKSVKNQNCENKKKQFAELELKMGQVKNIMGLVYYYGQQIQQFSIDKIKQSLRIPPYSQMIHTIQKHRKNKLKRQADKKVNKKQSKKDKYQDEQNYETKNKKSKKIRKNKMKKFDQQQQSLEDDEFIGFGNTGKNKKKKIEEFKSDGSDDSDDEFLIDD